jgi:hypothetical protein
VVCLNETWCFTHRPSDGQVIHSDLAAYAIRIDEVTCSEHNTFVLNWTPVVARHANVTARQQRELRVRSEAPRGAGPLFTGKVRALQVDLYDCKSVSFSEMGSGRR